MYVPFHVQYITYPSMYSTRYNISHTITIYKISCTCVYLRYNISRTLPCTLYMYMEQYITYPSMYQVQYITYPSMYKVQYITYPSMYSTRYNIHVSRTRPCTCTCMYCTRYNISHTHPCTCLYKVQYLTYPSMYMLRSIHMNRNMYFVCGLQCII